MPDEVTKIFEFEGGVVILGFSGSMKIQLTFNVEIGFACALLFFCSVFGSHALEVAGVQGSVDGSELQVASFLKAALWVRDRLAIVKPAVGDAARIVHLAPQHCTASMQCILGFGLLREMEGCRVYKKCWGKWEEKCNQDRPGNIVLLQKDTLQTYSTSQKLFQIATRCDWVQTFKPYIDESAQRCVQLKISCLVHIH